MRVKLCRVGCPVSLQGRYLYQLFLHQPEKRRYMVSSTIDSITFKIQSGWRNPDGIKAHVLDIIESGDERSPSPATIQSVSGVARRAIEGRGKAVGHDSGKEDIISRVTF